MIIIGADYHPAFQQIDFVDTEIGELQERRRERPEAAEKFYHELAAQGKKVRVGMEASGHARWFERLLACWGPSARVNNFETHDPGIY
jgi:transposase